MAYVQTVAGVHVHGKDRDNPDGTMTLEAAEASANERNRRAEDMGIEARYEAVSE